MNTTNALSPISYDASLPRPAICPTAWSVSWLAHNILRRYNQLRHALTTRRIVPTALPELADIRARATSVTDIDEHLELMFMEGLLCRPSLIVELGVRGGTSTYVFDKVARLCGSTLISCDLDDCSSVSSYQRWHFFRGDDIHFADSFAAFCRTRSITPEIDLLFIDTSHYYDHTVQEIASWFPFLSRKAKIMFHDTNLKIVSPRLDGCFALGWDNHRGVIRAIEDLLGVRIDEGQRYANAVPGWVIRHWPNCNGFTILDRIPE